MVSSSAFHDFDSLFSPALPGGEAPRKIEDGTTPLPQNEKIISFSERVKVIEIPNVKHLSYVERHALWHTHTESCEESLRRDGRKINLMRQLLCTSVDHRDDSHEGGDEDEEDPDIEERVRLPVCVVLMEQKSQRECGIVDQCSIAKVYKQSSAQSTMKAQIRAWQAEQEARDYYNASKSSRIRRKSKNILTRILVR